MVLGTNAHFFRSANLVTDIDFRCGIGSHSHCCQRRTFIFRPGLLNLLGNFLFDGFCNWCSFQYLGIAHLLCVLCVSVSQCFPWDSASELKTQRRRDAESTEAILESVTTES